MPKYLIERHLPGAGALPAATLKEISQKSNAVLSSLGPEIQWVHSYVTGDAIYCVYIAPDERLIREHGSRGGFPVTNITRIDGIIDPTTAD